jgi:WD40 repeat protein
MKESIWIIFIAFIILVFCGLGLLVIVCPDEEWSPLPVRSPDFEIKMDAACVAFSPDGKQIAVGRVDGWGLIDYESREIIKIHRWDMAHVSQICFSPDGKKLLTTREDKNIILWNIESKKELFRLNKIGICRSIGFSSDGTKIIAAFCQNMMMPGYVAIWDIETGKAEKYFPTECNHVDFSPDEKSVILAHHRQIERWDVETGKKLKRIKTFKYNVLKTGFSVDGQRMLVALSNNSRARLIDLKSGRTLKEFKNTKGRLNFAGLSKNGALALVGDSGLISTIGSSARTFRKPPFSNEYYSETHLGGLYVYASSSGEGIVRLGGHDVWSDFALSSDRSIAAGVTSGSVCFWDIRNISESSIGNQE